MRRTAVALAATGALLLAMAAPAFGASKNVRLVDNLPEAKNATAINFLEYGKGKRGKDVMLVTGRFGLKSYSLDNPRNPRLLDELTAEELRLEGDPPVDFTPESAPRSTFWQNEDMDVDRDRKLALLSRDPRAYAGSTTREPGETDPNGATNIAGVYIVDAKDPERLKLLTFQQLPTGHTTTCINGCKWLWSGGPAATTTQQTTLGWTRGRPIIVTDLTDPKNPKAYPNQPVDLLRVNGTVTGYSHDVQVDDAGVAWVSGDGGTRGYWTSGRHFDPVAGTTRTATPLDPVPYGGGGLEQVMVGDADGGFEHNAERPIGRDAPKGDPRYRSGELLLATEEDFGPANQACRNQGQFTIASLQGSFDGDAWRPGGERLKTVGSWSPYQKRGSRPIGGPYNPLANFCSAHYFDVEGSQVAYAWYGEGTRFLDISDPTQPIQYAYWRPDDGVVWASYMHKGYVYTADRTRGVDVLQLTKGAKAARAARREVGARAPSRKQRRFLAKLAWQYRADPGTAGLCFLQSQ
jgi:hypothetical protein